MARGKRGCCMSLISELKRRNVFRAAAFYAASAWLLVQVATQVFPFFHVAEWVVRWIVIAAVIGFPFAMLFSWFYEWTPHGIERESEVEQDASITRETGKKLDRWIIAILGMAVVLLLADVFVPHQDPGKTATADAAAKSIAVLPFVNMSGDPKNDYFSDGITEEILNALAQIHGLKVAARTSAFAFKGKDQDLRKIGGALDVATVLEGSVQRQGDDVRITAQLIDSRNGYHLWSQTYDRKLTNVFAVEDEISKAIAEKLQAQLGGGARTNEGTHDVQAHELYLRGLTLLAARGAGLRDAADAFRQAVAIDPTYAQAWASLAQALVLVHNWHFDSEGTAMHEANIAVQRALELDPDIATAHVALGIIHSEDCEWADADREFRRAVELAPGDAEVLDQYAQFLHDTGNMQAALPVIERANRLDPLSGVIGGVHALVLMDLRRPALARAQIDRTLAVAPASRFARGVALIPCTGEQGLPRGRDPGARFCTTGWPFSGHLCGTGAGRGRPGAARTGLAGACKARHRKNRNFPLANPARRPRWRADGTGKLCWQPDGKSGAAVVGAGFRSAARRSALPGGVEEVGLAVPAREGDCAMNRWLGEKATGAGNKPAGLQARLGALCNKVFAAP